MVKRWYIFHRMKSPKQCRYCGRELPPEHVGRGRQKQFCNDTCRVMKGYRNRNGVTTNREKRLRVLKSPYVPPVLTEVNKAWLAAMIDGEGSVSFLINQKSSGTRRFYYAPTVTFNNTDMRLVMRFRELVGERCTTVQERLSTGNFKTRYTVKVARMALIDLLTAIMPYLIAKQRQAAIVLEFCEIHDALPCKTTPLEKFAEMWAETRALNKRGVA